MDFTSKALAALKAHFLKLLVASFEAIHEHGWQWTIVSLKILNPALLKELGPFVSSLLAAWSEYRRQAVQIDRDRWTLEQGQKAARKQRAKGRK